MEHSFTKKNYLCVCEFPIYQTVLYFYLLTLHTSFMRLQLKCRLGLECLNQTDTKRPTSKLAHAVVSRLQFLKGCETKRLSSLNAVGLRAPFFATPHGPLHWAASDVASGFPQHQGRALKGSYFLQLSQSHKRHPILSSMFYLLGRRQ